MADRRVNGFEAGGRQPADADLQGVSFLDPAMIDGMRVDIHLFDPAGSIGADVMMVDPAAPSCVGTWFE